MLVCLRDEFLCVYVEKRTEYRFIFVQLSDLEAYHYELPGHLIRKVPLEKRDHARLFVYDTQKDTLTFDTFTHLAKYLPAPSLMVLNDTRVLPARLWLRKETGGKIEVLVLANQIEIAEEIPLLVDRKTMPGQKLFFPNEDFLEIKRQAENIFFARLESTQTIFALLDQFGTTPIPHYLEGNEVLEEGMLRKRYQSVFATAGASVAAPTASLHFTEDVFDSLRARGIETSTVTLNVGLGTFAPLREENFKTKTLHTEFVDVKEGVFQKILAAKREQKPVMAVGTTVTRTLEGLFQVGENHAYHGALNTFLFPPYHFQVVDILLTNFHLPKTSLLLLVDAFLESKGSQRRIIELYEKAIVENFCFYSFGDSMLIL